MLTPQKQTTMNTSNINLNPDVVLIGTGIMSATLGMLLKTLEPEITITIFERLNVASLESSDAWNNAGTGHSAFCELNYTPQKDDGSIDIAKAVKIAESFEVSKQFFAFLVEQGITPNPKTFINHIDHISFVQHPENIAFLKQRYEAMKANPLFETMEFTNDEETLKQWMPLMMQDRNDINDIAATKVQYGTDVNFGNLTRSMINHLKLQPGVQLFLSSEIEDIEKLDDGRWRVEVEDLHTKDMYVICPKFVFIGAGGGTLPLLLKTGISEAQGFGGFPVSGQWLKCTNPNIVAQHNAKVYGKASVGAPPMSVPHLDTRIINDKKELLFGPYAGFSTKFLKNGSYLDLPSSLRFGNIIPMVAAGLHNIPLTKYLIEQVSQSPTERLEALQVFYPDAKLEDWELVEAGQRVQVIKKDDEEGGVLEFGTEVVASADKSIAALLGASPGASTAVSIMLDILQKCFTAKYETEAWQSKLKLMIPTIGQSLAKNRDLCRSTRARVHAVLGLDE
jgi:malate dehydrogenase (quinone)